MHEHAGPHTHESLDDDLVGGLKTFLDDQPVGDLLSHSHRPDVDRAVRCHDADLVRPLELVDGPLGHDQRPLPNVDRGPHSSVLTWAQDVAAIRECTLDGDGARPRIDLAIGHDHGSACRVHAAVVEDEVEERIIAPRRLGPMVALGGAEVFDFADVELDLDRIDLRDRGHDRGRAHQAADLRLGYARDAVDRRSHLGPAVTELRLRKCGTRRLDARCRLLLGREIVVELLSWDHLLGDQLPVALDVEARLSQGRDVPLQGSFCLVGYRLVIARVDHEEEIFPPDVRPLLVRLLADIPFDLRPDIGVDEAVQSPNPLAEERDVHLFDLRHLDGGRWRRWSGGGLVTGGAGERQGDDPSARVHHGAAPFHDPPGARMRRAGERCRTAPAHIYQECAWVSASGSRRRGADVVGVVAWR